MSFVKFPSNIGTVEGPQYGMIFDIYVREGKSSSHEGTIFLPMPLALESPINVSWDQQALGTELGAGLENYMGAGSNLGSAAQAGASAWMQKNLSLRSTMANGLNMITGGGLGESVVSAGVGAIENPYMKMLFKGLNYRAFEFTFKLNPNTEKESTDIHNILKEFRKAALPEFIEGNPYLKYPKEVDIAYIDFYGQGGQQWLNKFKRCIITDMHINYTSAGSFAPMRNGFPAETELKIQFTENQLVDRKMVDEGY